MNYKLIGSHPEDTAEGAVLAPGELTGPNFDPAHPHNKRMIDEGLLIEAGEDASPKATDAAEQLASEKGINLASVTGTGSDGQITKVDVERHIAESPATEEVV